MRRLKINSSISAPELVDDKTLFPFIDNFFVLDGSSSADAEDGIFRKRLTLSTEETVSLDTGGITNVGFIVIKMLSGMVDVGVAGAMIIQLNVTSAPTCLFHSNSNDLVVHNPGTVFGAGIEYLVFESV